MWFRAGNMRLGFWAFPFVIGYYACAAAGIITWWLIKMIAFVLFVVPFRIAVAIRNAIYNKRVARASTRMRDYYLS